MTDHDQKTPPWVPISKDVSKLFPIDRPFTEIEAIVSLQLDHNNERPATVMGYAKRWRWTRRRVRSLFQRLGIEIEYPENTSKKQNQAGIISAPKYRTDKGTDNGQINFIDFSQLQAKADRS